MILIIAAISFSIYLCSAYQYLSAMEIKQLQIFVAVAESKSFSHAATKCNLTQAAISQQIKLLEDSLGIRLFERNSHQMHITAAGEELLTHARNILMNVAKAKEEIKSINGELNGELRIGVGHGIEPYIRKAISKMMKDHPKVTITEESGKACRLNQLLIEHKIDVAFSMNKAYAEEGISSKPCIPFRLCAIMPKTHALAKNKSVSFDELKKNYVIMPDVGDRAFATIQKYLKRDLRELKVRAVVNSTNMLLEMVEDMNMITFLPSIYTLDHPNMVAIPIDELSMELVSNVHVMTDIYEKRSLKVFLDILKKDAIPYINALK